MKILQNSYGHFNYVYFFLFHFYTTSTFFEKRRKEKVFRGWGGLFSLHPTFDGFEDCFLELYALNIIFCKYENFCRNVFII